MLEFVLIICVVCLILGSMLYYNTVNDKISSLSRSDRELVRKAAELSIVGSQTLNPVLSLIYAAQSEATLNNLIVRYGPDLAKDVCGVDVQDLLDTVSSQKECVLADLLKENPQWRPEHPMLELAGGWDEGAFERHEHH